MEIKNIPALLYCLQTSLQDLDKTLTEKKKGVYSNEDNYEIYFQVGTVLFWVISCYDRLEPLNVFSAEEKNFFSALKCANNAQKHNASLFRLDKPVGGLSFPFSIPEEGFSIEEINIVWNSINDVENIHHLDQKECYKKHLEGNPIEPTIEKAVYILTEYLQLL